LPGPVRADDSDPAAGPDRQRDAAKDLVGTVGDGDVDERDRMCVQKGPPDEERELRDVVS